MPIPHTQVRGTGLTHIASSARVACTRCPLPTGKATRALRSSPHCPHDRHCPMACLSAVGHNAASGGAKPQPYPQHIWCVGVHGAQVAPRPCTSTSVVARAITYQRWGVCPALTLAGLRTTRHPGGWTCAHLAVSHFSCPSPVTGWGFLASAPLTGQDFLVGIGLNEPSPSCLAAVMSHCARASSVTPVRSYTGH